MMHIFSALSALAAMVYIIIGMRIYSHNKKSNLGFIFLILNILLAIWSEAYAFAYIAETENIFSLWNKVAAIGWCLFPAFVLYLVLTVIEYKYNRHILFQIFFFLPGVISFILSVFFFWPSKDTNPFIYHLFYTLNPVYNIVYILLSIVLLVYWGVKTENQINQNQAKILVVTSVTTSIIYLITEVVLPAYRIISIPNVTQIYFLIVILGIYYAMVRYNFLLFPNDIITNELFQRIGDITFLVNLDGKIVRANKQVYDLLEYKIEDLVDTSITDIILDIDFKDLLIAAEGISEDNELYNINMITKKGELIPFNISITPMKSCKNQIVLGFLIVGQDIRVVEDLKKEMKEHKSTAERLIASEELFRLVAETIPFAILFTRKSDNTIFYLNNNTQQLFHTSHEEFLGIKAEKLYVNHEDRKDLLKTLNESGEVMDREILFKRLDDTVFTGVICMVPATFHDEEVLLSCITDITEQRILQKNIKKSEEMLRKLLDSIPDLVVVSDIKGYINYTSKSIKNILGYNPVTDVIPGNVLYYLVDEQMEEAKENLMRILKEDIGPVAYKLRKKDGELLEAEVNATVLYDETNLPFGIVFVARDITERKKAEEALTKSKAEIEKINLQLLQSFAMLREKSIHDGLTNLYNHKRIIEVLDYEILIEKKNAKGLCLMMLDIDHFKGVNDNYGHQVGDLVLKTIADIIKDTIKVNGYAGRYGGEEFMVILPGTQMEEALEISTKIRIKIQNYIFENEGLHVTISIGLTIYHGEEAEYFISIADKLLYKAKENGRNRIESLT